MAGEVLSQEEIERLLCGMSGTPAPQSDENRDSGILSKDELNALFGGACPRPAIPMPDESNKKKPTEECDEERMANGEVLSQTEVENLLNMACPTNLESLLTYVSTRTSTKTKPNTNDEYEPPIERLDKAQLRQLQLMHEKLARIFAAKVSAMLQSVVEVKLTSIDHLAYSEFVFGCDNPTCFNLIQTKLSRGNGNMILDINPSICFLMIERMLGGGRVTTGSARRPLTRIETRLVQQVIDLFLKELRDVWQKIVELEFTVEQTESNPLLNAF